MGNEEILICQECKKIIKEGERIVSLDVGDLEIMIHEDNYVVPLNQGSVAVGLWHVDCYLDGYTKGPLRVEVRQVK